MRSTPTGPAECQAGLKQTERFSLASHQLPQRRVKQAVAGLAVPSATILLSHMGAVRPGRDDSGSAGSARYGLTRESFRKGNNSDCRPERRRESSERGRPGSPQPQQHTSTVHPDTLHNHLRPSECNKAASARKQRREHACPLGCPLQMMMMACVWEVNGYLLLQPSHLITRVDQRLDGVATTPGHHSPPCSTHRHAAQPQEIL